MIGSMLAHYKVTGKAGSGGMGDVYVAEDARLHRRVALKLLPAETARDPERRNRFEREARAVAALNHPNIVTIYSVETDRDIHFITMELLDGVPLGEVIPAKGLPLGRILELALPLTEAVCAAHLRGITHRDLKPDNIMVCRDGRVKVLDFGLAKVREEDEGEATSGSRAPTRVITGMGRVLGTASYMSPEQAEGREVDPRTDVFALGILLYEMATGCHPFQSETRASTIASILRDDPRPVSEINPALPRDLSRIVRLCLAKEPLRRYQSAIDLRNELGELKRELDSGELDSWTTTGRAGRPRERRSWAPAAVAAASLAAAVAAVSWIGLAGSGDGPPPPPPTFSQLTDLPGEELFPSLSPDGKTVAYAAREDAAWEIFVQRVGGQNPRNLTANPGSSDTHPAFSPDGESIAFRSERDGGGIFVMGATGESVRRLTGDGHHPAWSPDGSRIVYATAAFESPNARASASELRVVPSRGGEPETIVGQDAIQPSWSPGGSRIAYWGISPGGGQRDIWTVASDGTDPRPVTDDPDMDWNPVWAPDGRGLYFSSDRGGAMNLWRIPVDQETGEVMGPPEPVTTGVASSAGYHSISAGGEIAYVSRSRTGNIYKVDFDPDTATAGGPPSRVTRGSGSVEWPDLSPDGTLLVFSSFGRQEDLFIMAPDGTGRRRLTDDPFNDRVARWSPDGAEIAFYSDRSGSYEIWAIRPDGSGMRQITDTPGRSMTYPIWSPAGDRMIALDFDHGDAVLFDPAQPWSGQEPRIIHLDIGENVRFAPWSWSASGDLILGSLVRDTSQFVGIATYDLRAGELRDVYPGGSFPIWLDDGHRALFTDGEAIQVLSFETLRTGQVLTAKPDEIPPYSVRLAPGGRQLFFTRVSTEADIWLVSRRRAPDPEADRLRKWARRIPGAPDPRSREG